MFEWKNTDDTFQQGGYLGSTIIKANEKFGLKTEDEIGKEKADEWKTKSFEQMTERDWRIFR